MQQADELCTARYGAPRDVGSQRHERNKGAGRRASCAPTLILPISSLRCASSFARVVASWASSGPEASGMAGTRTCGSGAGRCARRWAASGGSAGGSTHGCAWLIFCAHLDRFQDAPPPPQDA